MLIIALSADAEDSTLVGVYRLRQNDYKFELKGILIMMNESGKCGKHIKGINCSVKNCVYHDGECYCTAENIHVGPNHAEKSADTVCATFKCEGNC